MFHADGRLPYFPWWVNTPVQCLVLLGRLVGTRTGIIRGNQGPWGDWDRIIDSKIWQEEFFKYGKGLETVRRKLMRDEDIAYEEGNLTKEQKRNLFQVIYFLSAKSI